MESDSRKFQIEKSIQSVRYACTSVTLNLIQLPIQFHIVSWTFFRKRLIHCCQSLNGGSESGKWNWVSASSKLINIWVLILPPQAKSNSPTEQNIEQFHFQGSLRWSSSPRVWQWTLTTRPQFLAGGGRISRWVKKQSDALKHSASTISFRLQPMINHTLENPTKTVRQSFACLRHLKSRPKPRPRPWPRF